MSVANVESGAGEKSGFQRESAERTGEDVDRVEEWAAGRRAERGLQGADDEQADQTLASGQRMPGDRSSADTKDHERIACRKGSPCGTGIDNGSVLSDLGPQPSESALLTAPEAWATPRPPSTPRDSDRRTCRIRIASEPVWRYRQRKLVGSIAVRVLRSVGSAATDHDPFVVRPRSGS